MKKLYKSSTHLILCVLLALAGASAATAVNTVNFPTKYCAVLEGHHPSYKEDEMNNVICEGKLTIGGVERSFSGIGYVFQNYGNTTIVNMSGYLDGIEEDKNMMIYSVHLDRSTGDMVIPVTFGWSVAPTSIVFGASTHQMTADLKVMLEQRMAIAAEQEAAIEAQIQAHHDSQKLQVDQSMPQVDKPIFPEFARGYEKELLDGNSTDIRARWFTLRE